MIKLIAFDLDGTLADSLEDLADSVNKALSDLGFPEHDVNEYRYFVGSGADKLIERALPEDKRDKETFEAARAGFKSYYNENYCNKTVAYEQISELLESLEEEHYKLAVLSNKPDEYVHHLVEHLFPEIDFDFILGASDEFPKKPAPDGLLRCLDELRLDPEECVYCGDSDVDVYFAHNAGIQVIGAAWGFRGIDELDAAGADYVINYPSDLSMILDILN